MAGKRLRSDQVEDVPTDQPLASLAGLVLLAATAASVFCFSASWKACIEAFRADSMRAKVRSPPPEAIAKEEAVRAAATKRTFMFFICVSSIETF
ncbi:protein of unknown function [Pseudomonas inefficax]|uniref:Uncharacterized protein n=1 Tax=Pseudomonas inefficax TaxID=2078786 RepID=A0AAQ1SW59_9PSED|nr:protein of unknown function [Pseudomonas inefficax]